MPTPKKTKVQLSTIAAKAVRNRRRAFPGGSAERLNADSVQKAFKGRKSFSTGDIMKEFDAARDNATAVAAVLRARKLTEKIGEAPDGTAVWRWA